MLALNGCLVIVCWTVKDYSFARTDKTKIYSDYDLLGIGTMGFCKLPLSSGLLEVGLC
jgi:hypothetical protein